MFLAVSQQNSGTKVQTGTKEQEQVQGYFLPPYAQQVSKVMKVSIELDTKTNELRQLYANCLRNYQYEQRLMKSQTVSDKLKQDEYSEKLKGYNRWFDDMNDTALSELAPPTG